MPLRVSVLIPCYNAGAWIDGVLRSCLEQGERLGEIIVVDDGSSDDSIDVVDRYSQRHPGIVRLHRNPSKGANSARSFAFSLSSCELIQWLDADDYLLPGKLDAQSKAFEKDAELELVYSDWEQRWYDGEHREASRQEVRRGRRDSLVVALARDEWSVPASYLVRRSLAQRLEAVAAWNTARRVAQDREYFTLAALYAKRIEFVDGVFAVYNRQAAGTTSHIEFARRLELQMDLDLRLRDAFVESSLSSAERRKCLNAINTHALNAAFYNPRVRPRFLFSPLRIDLPLIHWKKRLILPILYAICVLGYFRWCFRERG